jgi:hypothetical protein
MIECYGNGSCFEKNIHGVYKNLSCIKQCKMVSCENYMLCKNARPKWVLECNNGLCGYCTMRIGKLTISSIDTCPICLDTKSLVKINCGNHSVCIECWKRWADTCKKDVSCMLCRKVI